MLLALWVGLAFAGPFDDRCITAPINEPVGPLPWGPTMLVDSNGGLYGSTTCPATFLSDAKITPLGEITVSVEMVIPKPPPTQADCEKLVLTAWAWMEAPSGWVTTGPQLPTFSGRKLGDWRWGGRWADGRCTLPTVTYLMGEGTHFILAGRAAVLDPKGREVPSRLRMGITPHALIPRTTTSFSTGPESDPIGNE